MTVNLTSFWGVYRIVSPILGLGILFWGIWWTRAKTVPVPTPTENTPQQVEFAAGTPLDPRQDAFDHLNIEQNRPSHLQVNKGVGGWPVLYPIKIYNFRPVDLFLSGYAVTILFDDVPVQYITWSRGSSQTSNGLTVEPEFRLQSDMGSTHSIPVNLVTMPNLPTASPRWGAKGDLHFTDGLPSKVFDIHTDYYQLPANDWEELKQATRPK